MNIVVTSQQRLLLSSRDEESPKDPEQPVTDTDVDPQNWQTAGSQLC